MSVGVVSVCVSELVYFKDLCVARCIHTLESGNCTSRGGLGRMSLVNDYQTFRPNLGSSSVVMKYRAW